MVSTSMGLWFAFLLFSLGLIGVLTRRNLLFILMSIEIMLNAAGLAFVVVGAHEQEADGQIMFLFILVMAAAEVAIGLALVMRVHRIHKSIDADVLRSGKAGE